MAAATLAVLAAAATLQTAIVTTDQAVLRAAPRDSAAAQTQLWQGETLEIRGERLDYLQVWDHARERGGYVKATQVRRLTLVPSEAPDLLAVLRFMREAPGAEALGIGLAAAWLQAAPPEAVRGPAGAEALDALGQMAERLAARATANAGTGKAQATMTAHLDVASRYGVKFTSYEQPEGMRICYDGDAFRRLLALPAAQPAQQARAALALSQPDCADPRMGAEDRRRLQQWQAELVQQIDAQALPPHLKARLALRRASAWSSVAHAQARRGESPQEAAQRALDALGSVQRADLVDDDVPAWHDAVMRTNAVRWAVLPQGDGVRGPVRIELQAGQPGETCVALVADASPNRAAAAAPGPQPSAVAGQRTGAAPSRELARRCTYALVWPQSATLNREGNALALAVQPLDGWRELWVFRREGRDWRIDVLPPASVQPGIGYAEFAGWVPGGRQMLVAREARGEGRYRRSYDVVDLDTLATQRHAADPAVLGPFQRWQDAGWKRMTVSLR